MQTAESTRRRHLIRQLPLARWLMGWRTYYADGARRTLSQNLRLGYGALGAVFLVFTAFTAESGRSDAARESLQPSAWYWKWVSAHKPAGKVESFEFFRNEMDSHLRNGRDADTEVDRASWGTDSRKTSVRLWMGMGARNYLLYGILASICALVLATAWALFTEWIARPGIPWPQRVSLFRLVLRRLSQRVHEAVDNVPKFFLLLFIFAAGYLTVPKFALGMAVFLGISSIPNLQERIRNYLASDHYLCALEIGVSPLRLMLVHLVKRTLLPFLIAYIPFMLSSYILWEATMSFFGYPATGMYSWGKLLLDSFNRTSEASFRIPLVSILLVVSSLYVFSDGLRARILGEE